MSIRRISARELLGAKAVVVSASVFPQLLKRHREQQEKASASESEMDAKPEAEKR
jgi:hypothetical protein